MPSRMEGVLCAAAGLLVVQSLRVRQPPGSGAFFAIQAMLWGLASGTFALSRRIAWRAKYGGKEGDPPSWTQRGQPMPAWAFESSAWTMVMVYIPIVCAMALKCFASRQAFFAAHAHSFGDFVGPEDLWLEHLIYSSLFGFMCRDFVLHFQRPDPLLTVHHILVCFLMVSVSFWEVQGFRLLAFTTPVVELGSCAYCFWCVHQWRRLYVFAMTASNIIWVISACACTFLHDFSLFQLCLWVVGISMAAGRQIFLASEMRVFDASVAKSDR
mmetsp:Transcript_37375/g.98566  ORF Transcript_37375/g.98566 Transcript_37375/m.98566 type:complete len:270 (+) Transcript_37375:69-878(+)